MYHIYLLPFLRNDKVLSAHKYISTASEVFEGEVYLFFRNNKPQSHLLDFKCLYQILYPLKYHVIVVEILISKSVITEANTIRIAYI